jgi:hypothetical protein
MKNKIIIFAFFATCLFAKCTHSSTEGEGSISKDKNALTLKFDFDEDPVDIHEIGLIYDVEILNLDCEEAIFGEIGKIIRYKNRIYLLDQFQTHSVFIYDTLGNFINLIEKRGQGPNEYIQLFDMFINPDDETLNLVSRVDMKILKHDLDGNIISVEKAPQIFTALTKTKDGYIGWMGNVIWDKEKPYNVWTLSNTLEVKDVFFEIDPTWNSKMMGGGYQFSSYEDKTYYITPLDFNIYSLKNGKFSIAYTYDFGKWTWPENYKEFDKYEELLENGGGRAKYIHRFYRFQETQNHLIAEVLHQGQFLFCVYNKQTKKTYVAKQEVYKDKYFFGFGKVIGFDEKAIYTLMDASNLKRVWDGKDKYGNDFESTYPEQVKRLREKFSHIDEDGNPFLIIYSIK